MIIANAKILLWLILFGALVAYEVYHWETQKRLLAIFFSQALSSLMLRHWDGQRERLKRVLFLLAIFFLILALARPQWGKRSEVVTKPGIDLVIAIDVSKSMLTKDLKPNRLSNAQEALNLLLDQLAGNRLALVAFAGSSFIECPLTADLGALKIFLAALKPDLIPVPGTDLGGAIHTAIQAFGDSAASKAVILITDGEDLSGSAMSAAAEAANRGIRLYPIGIGTALGEAVPEIDESGNEVGPKRDKKGGIVVSRLDEKLLSDLAQKTGGQAFFVGSGRSTLPELLAAISTLPKKALKNTLTYEHQERFQIFLFLALICLLAEYLIVERKE